MRRATVSLLHGLHVNGQWLREAQMRELNGYDEELLFELRDASPLSRSKAMLERVVDFLDRAGANNDELATHLTVGDMAALVLHLRRITFGNRFQCLMICPACQGEVSTDIPVSQLLQTQLPQPRETHNVKVGDFTLLLRPVTSGDLERLRSIDDGKSLEERLVRACVVSSNPRLPADIDADLIAGIGSKLSELDPQADIILDLTCPICSHRFQVPFFPEDFFLREFDARQSQFEGEVHWLAFNYHWSDEAILSLPMTKRKRYVELINRTLSGEGV